MNKVLASLLVFCLICFTATMTYAQDEESTESTEQMEEQAPEEETAPEPTAEASPETTGEKQKATGVQLLKKYFIEGGWGFMSLVLVCLILGLAFCIERIISLNIATTNTDKLIDRIDSALKDGNVDEAMNVAKSTQGPTASILHEGLKRHGEGIESVEKAIVNYGAVQMGLLERGLVWISLFISIAPMLGFMGTVIGMIQAFDRIEEAGDINASIVAGGIKVALLTTVFGLIVAIILQIFYNYIVSKIDGIVNRMEDASISLVDVLVDNKVVRTNS